MRTYQVAAGESGAFAQRSGKVHKSLPSPLRVPDTEEVMHLRPFSSPRVRDEVALDTNLELLSPLLWADICPNLGPFDFRPYTSFCHSLSCSSRDEKNVNSWVWAAKVCLCFLLLVPVHPHLSRVSTSADLIMVVVYRPMYPPRCCCNLPVLDRI